MANDNHTPISQLRLFRRTKAVLEATEGWTGVLLNVSRTNIHHLISAFVEQGATQKQLDTLFHRMTSMIQEDKDHLKKLVASNFKPEQIHLFVHATQQERHQLMGQWKKGLIKSATGFALQAPQTAQTATTVFVAGGGIACLAFIGMSFITQDGAMAQTGRALLGALTNPPLGVDNTGWNWPSIGGVMASGASVSAGAALLLLCAKSASSVIGELLKPDPQEVLHSTKRDLEDRILGVFARMDNPEFPTVKGGVTSAEVKAQLLTVEDAYFPLLTHFEPKELVTFLMASDAGREEMMRVNPPMQEQRVNTVRALHASSLRRVWETARQSLTAWDGAFARGPAVTLRSALTAFRAKQAQERPAVVGPALS